jgi:hypothetical protein
LSTTLVSDQGSHFIKDAIEIFTNHFLLWRTTSSSLYKTSCLVSAIPTTFVLSPCFCKFETFNIRVSISVRNCKNTSFAPKIKPSCNP